MSASQSDSSKDRRSALPSGPGEEEPAQPAPSLCNGCDLCCDGTFLDRGRIRPDEETQPLSFYKNEFARSEGSVWFKLPCAHYEGNGCPIYDSRFATCRRYRCKLLKEVDSGDVEFGAAQGTIRKAKSLIAAIQAAEGQRPTKQARATILRELRAALPEASPQEQADIGRRIVNIVALNRFLELHFHSAKVPAEASQEGRQP